MTHDFGDPHFDGFPPPEAGEELELFDLLIDLLLLQPLLQVNKLNRLAPIIVTKPLLTNRIVFKVRLLILLLNLLIVDDL